MKQFNDRTNKSWQIDLTIGAVMRVRGSSEFDLLDPSQLVDGKPLQVVLSTDCVKFWELLWLIVEPQAIERGITAAQFGELMAADCLIEAQAAFMLEWHDFFRCLRRPDASLAVETQAKTMAAAVRLVTAKMNAIDQAGLMRSIESKLEKAISVQYGALQASLDAIQEDTPGGS